MFARLTHLHSFLNPGGTLELLDIIYPAESDDGTLSKDSNLYVWSKTLLDGFTTNGRPLNSALKYKELLEEAGFVDVVVKKYKWPSNRWPKDYKHKQIGKLLNTIDSRNFRGQILIRRVSC